MNNLECNVVRDLMPLCIDDAASEESRKLVVDHVWECEKCGNTNDRDINASINIMFEGINLHYQ